MERSSNASVGGGGVINRMGSNKQSCRGSRYTSVLFRGAQCISHRLPEYGRHQEVLQSDELVLCVLGVVLLSGWVWRLLCLWFLGQALLHDEPRSGCALAAAAWPRFFVHRRFVLLCGEPSVLISTFCGRARCNKRSFVGDLWESHPRSLLEDRPDDRHDFSGLRHAKLHAERGEPHWYLLCHFHVSSVAILLLSSHLQHVALLSGRGCCGYRLRFVDPHLWHLHERGEHSQHDRECTVSDG
mmetsp:Transcript_53193/g.142264  ORF Transcript_53193/g.142264 Transcript_53193/m.142264 type:complete len:242 (-) Transcript_53193:56-781(-)